MPRAEARLYRWEELPVDRPMETLARRRVIGDQAMISEVTLEAGCDVPAHHHANEQFAHIVRGALRFGIGEAGTPEYHEFVARAGDIVHLPSHVPHSAVALEESVVLDIFSPPSEGTGIDGPTEADADG